jgi:hypothetical protein
MSNKLAFAPVVALALAVAAGCGSSNPTSPTPVPPPTTFTYTMAGMPDGTSVQVLVTGWGTCTGLSSNGKMVCSATLTPGQNYLITAHNTFTGQDDCTGLTVSTGLLSLGTSATGCPALFQNK